MKRFLLFFLSAMVLLLVIIGLTYGFEIGETPESRFNSLLILLVFIIGTIFIVWGVLIYRTNVLSGLEEEKRYIKTLLPKLEIELEKGNFDYVNFQLDLAEPGLNEIKSPALVEKFKNVRERAISGEK